MTLRYCARCIMPETKPDLWFNDNGVCSACLAYEQRASVDWDARLQELHAILTRFKKHPVYDCVVPSSGGKDSHFQVLKVLELGYRPLVVTATTDHLTDLGRANIENLKRQGVDYVEVSCNPVVRRRLNRLALETVGDISWPEHVSIFTIPVRLAVNYGIPLILWGENSQNEYGGPAQAQETPTLNRRWLEEFGGLLGLRVSDLESAGFQPDDTWIYTYPTQGELDAAAVTGAFLGYYVPWDGWQNQLIAQAHGFRTYPHHVEGSLANYENLDNAQTGIHDYFKFLKFGFGRATDIACMQIRRGRLDRVTAARLAVEAERFPKSYLGYELGEILAPLNLSVTDFVGICDRFTNRALFEEDSDGTLRKEPDGTPVRRYHP